MGACCVSVAEASRPNRIANIQIIQEAKSPDKTPTKSPIKNPYLRTATKQSPSSKYLTRIDQPKKKSGFYPNEPPPSTSNIDSFNHNHTNQYSQIQQSRIEDDFDRPSNPVKIRKILSSTKTPQYEITPIGFLIDSTLDSTKYYRSIPKVGRSPSPKRKEDQHLNRVLELMEIYGVEELTW